MTSTDTAPTAAAPSATVIEDRLDLVEAAEAFVKDKFRDHDPSHDWHHVHRVRLMALNLTRCDSVRRQAGADEQASPDLLVVELAALFHDLCDAKYIPSGQKPSTVNAKAVLAPFFASLQGDHIEHIITTDQIALVHQIVDSVSWSKEEARRQRVQQRQQAGHPVDPRDAAQDEFEQRCSEFKCVSDADRLDAIGSIGVLRVAAFSAAKNRPLYIPPANPQNDPVPPAEQASGYNGSAVAHFYEKLLKIRGDRLKTDMARQEAERRQSSMASFLGELDLEWLVADQGAQMSLLQ